ncbi:ABC transporter permease [Clostridium felsineum]|uniref:Uncharacterized protein n=1 Tax=Clostridium felsineum TaxID=36839 RepID=A0A1S8KYD8_9CLOT|nr:ABC transporter permease [Clostridium felsineum]URZ02538.1 hypothetical protein CLAUR_025500 [Clostridium felsineum]URZ09767.1 hypothetical protein CROST_004600 [Clostridium felsineum]
MYNLIKADIFKLRKSKAIKILFGITVITSIIMVLLAYFIGKGKISASTSGIGFLTSDASVISILGAAIAGIFICGDFDNRTIHEAIVNGNSRCQVVISKAIILYIGVLVILLPYIIMTIIAIVTGYKFNMGAVALGFLNMITTECGKILYFSEIIKLVVIIITQTIVYCAQLSICVPLAIGFKRPVIVIAVYYGISILSGQLGNLEARYKAFANIIQFTPYCGKYCRLTLSTGRSNVIFGIISSLIFGGLMIAITCFAFRKSEIK